MSYNPFNNQQSINQIGKPTNQNSMQTIDSDRMIIEDTNLPSISQNSNVSFQTFNPMQFQSSQMQAPQYQFQQIPIQNYQPQFQQSPSPMPVFQQTYPSQIPQMQAQQFQQMPAQHFQAQQYQQMQAQASQFQKPAPQKFKLPSPSFPPSQFQPAQQPQYQSIPGQPSQPQFSIPSMQPQYSSLPSQSNQPVFEQYQQPQLNRSPVQSTQPVFGQYQQPQIQLQYNQSALPTQYNSQLSQQSTQPSPSFVQNSINLPNPPQGPLFFGNPSSSQDIYQQLNIPMTPDDDDDKIDLKPISEETKTLESSMTASMNFLFNYLELKDTEQEIPCTLSLAGSEIDMTVLQRNRAGLDLICVVDVSGSMAGSKLELVQKTLEFMVTLLNCNDRVSIVAFSDFSCKVIKLTAISNEGKLEVERAIARMRTLGGTNIVSGLQKGLEIASNRRIVNQVTSILLLSDGVDNDNNTVVERARLCSDQFKTSIKDSYTVHTFGYGADHNAKVMQEMAKTNNGNFYYIENPKDIAEAFANCLGELVSVVADKIEVALITQPCSIPFHLHKVYSENGDTHFSMPQVFAGNKKDSVFVLKFPPTTERVPENEIIKPLKARISYEAKSGENKIIETELSILVVNEGREDIEVNEDVMVNFYRCKGAEILKEVASLAEERKYNEARTAALNGANEFKNCMVNEHTIVKALIHDLEDAAKRASSNVLWEQGGRAQVSSVQANHFCQKASSNSVSYQNRCQTMYSQQAANYFNSPKNP